MEIDLKQLRELMRSLKQFDVHEIEIEKDGERVYLRRGADAVAPAMVAPSMPQSSIPPSYAQHAAAVGGGGGGGAEAKSAAPASDANVVSITSPFVGTFYRSPSPDAAAFVDVGSEIRAGQVLCIVEVMKLMNEIEAEISGTIVEVMVENGKPVEYGDALFRVRKS